MFNLFKKEKFNYTKNVEVLDKPIKKSVKETIEEIHETFYTEVDRIKKECSNLNSLETTKQALIDKRNKLVDNGFRNTKECKEAEIEINRLRTLSAENTQKEKIAKAANYFSFTYPHYKFITEDSVKKICQKYNLIYGEVSKYIGTVPDLNLKQIQEFKIKEEDECYAKYYNYRGGWNSSKDFTCYLNNILEEREKQKEYENYIAGHDGAYIHRPINFRSPFESHESIEKCPLEICAPLKDFDTRNMEVKDFKLSKIEIPDPVVLKPVHFESSKYYLIVTAWGDEASDPLVQNPIHN